MPQGTHVAEPEAGLSPLCHQTGLTANALLPLLSGGIRGKTSKSSGSLHRDGIVVLGTSVCEDEHAFNTQAVLTWSG